MTPVAAPGNNLDARPQLITLWDGRAWPGCLLGGMPAFDFRCAPSGLLTRRQLRAANLSPGGHEPYARLVWRRGKRWAWLWRQDLAVAKRIPSPAQLESVAKALRARQVCSVHGPVDYCVRADGLCGDCHVAGVTPASIGLSSGPSSWERIYEWGTAA